MITNLISSVSGELINLAPEIRNYIFKSYKNLKRRSRKLSKPVSQKIHVQDVSTNADHKVGQLLIERVYKKYSKHIRVESEEKRERIGKGETILRFDPIDGSKHYKIGIPLLSTSISLIKGESTLFGMVIDIFSDDIYYAFKNEGSFLNGKQIKIGNSGIEDDFSFVLYEAPNSKVHKKNPGLFLKFSNKLSALQKKAYRTRNIGLSSLSICYVADGSSPAFVDFSGTTKLYDIEASLLIAKESGAMVGNIKGKKVNTLKYEGGGDKKFIEQSLVIANPKAFVEIKSLLSGL